MEYLLIYTGVGLNAGFLAGFFGVGGGLIIVPALTMIFAAQHSALAGIVTGSAMTATMGAASV